MAGFNNKIKKIDAFYTIIYILAPSFKIVLLNCQINHLLL